MPTTIAQATDAYLDTISLSRSENTFHPATATPGSPSLSVLEEYDLLPDKTLHTGAASGCNCLVRAVSEGLLGHRAGVLTAAAGFYEFLAAERLAGPNLPRLRLLIHSAAVKPAAAATFRQNTN
jgi:hypothetical protein